MAKRYALILGSSMLLLNLLVACSNKQTSEEITLNSNITQKPQIKTIDASIIGTPARIIDRINNTTSIRAQTQTENGTLFIRSNGFEEIGHLDAPSLYGKEGDLTFRGNYSIIYRHDNKEHVILKLSDLTFIQTSEHPISFDKISFKEADVYLLTPQYQAGHGFIFCAIAIRKGATEALPLIFSLENGIESNFFNYYGRDYLPYNKNGMLVVKPGISAGTSEKDAQEKYFNLDLNKKMFIQVKPN